MSCNREEEKNRIMQETLKQIHAPSAVTHTKTFRKLVGQFLNSVQNEGIKTACSRTSVYIAKHLRFSRQCQDAYYSINACSGDTIARDVVFVPGVSGPSQRYRVNNIAEGLSELGYDVSVLPGHRVGRLLEVKPPGAVVFFRCAHCSHLPFVQAAASLHQRGTRVIMDHDDIVFNPEIVNSIDSYRKMNKGEQRVYMSDVLRYRELMFFGDAATVTTKSLAKEAESLIENVHILPNTVNVRQIGLSEKLLAHPLEKRPGITIMYSSGTTTHDADFMQCSEALMRFMEQRPESKFLLMGYLKLPNGFNQFGDRVIRLPFRDYETHLRECSRADINIAPLESTPFNNAKSELKIFEPGLVEVPTIMSPVASYAEYVQDGIDGVLAANEDEWHKAFTRLADDAELRASMGKRARQKALDKNHYRNVAAEAARIYGLDAEVHARVLPETIAEPNFLKKPNISHLRISWIVADIILGSGGLRNIFRAAHHLSRLGHDIDIYDVNTDLHNA